MTGRALCGNCAMSASGWWCSATAVPQTRLICGNCICSRTALRRLRRELFSLLRGGTTLVLPPTVRKKDLAKELGVSRTTLWRMTKRQEEAARKQREETSNS